MFYYYNIVLEIVSYLSASSRRNPAINNHKRSAALCPYLFGLAAPYSTTNNWTSLMNDSWNMDYD